MSNFAPYTPRRTQKLWHNQLIILPFRSWRAISPIVPIRRSAWARATQRMPGSGHGKAPLGELQLRRNNVLCGVHETFWDIAAQYSYGAGLIHQSRRTVFCSCLVSKHAKYFCTIELVFAKVLWSEQFNQQNRSSPCSVSRYYGVFIVSYCFENFQNLHIVWVLPRDLATLSKILQGVHTELQWCLQGRTNKVASTRRSAHDASPK